MTSEEKQVRVFLYVKMRETKKKGKSIKFKAFTTKMNIEVLDNDGKSLGKQLKYIKVKFSPDIEQSRINELGRGVLTAKLKDINAPYRYQIKTIVNDDGQEEKVYPYVYINDFVSFEPKTKIHEPEFIVPEDDEDDEVTDEPIDDVTESDEDDNEVELD